MFKEAQKVVADKVEALLKEGVDAKDRVHIKVQMSVNINLIDEEVAMEVDMDTNVAVNKAPIESMELTATG